ncbi:MAG: hypothetical protein Kow0069_26980 [Promethearchaeota archaeon]
MSDLDKDWDCEGIASFLGSFVSEVRTLWGENAIGAIVFRIGQKPAQLVAKNILKRYSKSEDEPLESPGAAFSLLENSLGQLFHVEVVAQEDSDKETVVRIKNRCCLRRVVASREDLKFGSTLCKFAAGYFETALKILTGLEVEYIHRSEEGDACLVDLRFRKKSLV